MKSPLVSVIMPTFKREKTTVERAVKSVLNQGCENLELIIVDDSPPDFDGRKNIEKLIINLNDNRVRYIKHDVNKGANIARNTGITNANGKYIAFLDDDDEWLPTKLQKQLKMFDNPSVGLVYSPYYIFRNGEKHVRRRVKNGHVYKELLYGNFIGSTSCVVIDKNCILDFGLFDEKLPASQDYDLYLRISKRYIIEVVDEPLILYYEHDGERISRNPLKKQEARKYIYNKYKEDIKKYPKINSDKNLLLAHSYSLSKNTKLKWKHWFCAVLSYPIPSKRLFKFTIKILSSK